MSPRLLGLTTLAATLFIDQGHKLWMLFVYRISERQPVHVGPFLDLIVAWNPGISYSLLRATTDVERYILLVVALSAVMLLFVWLWRSRSRMTALALGLIVGGALGNAYDRWAYGAVADFFHFHVGNFSWYVFNLADVAIVIGVALLLLESLFPAAFARKSRPEAPVLSD
ncbi:MAG: signal peptidase II [Beijerinckiaceae bacterium]